MAEAGALVYKRGAVDREELWPAWFPLLLLHPSDSSSVEGEAWPG